MLDVTPKDIAALNDGDLRALVARLCETVMRRRGLSTSAVTWGGDQDAADGGIDVHIELPESTDIEGYIPRPATGFQVKKPDMSPKKINTEMRPEGVLRPAIKELIALGGAYIIVSSDASVTDSVLRNRREAMRNALQGEANSDQLVVDFYDRTRIATWVNDHPSLIPWIREKAGRPLVGWQSFGAWAFSPAGSAEEYLVDDSVRFHDPNNGGEQTSIVKGITRIRTIVKEAGKSVRLVGLSGVGKTRFVQALFDERVGEHPLNPSLVIYADMADGPEPQPIALATQLRAMNAPTILVIDNCPQDLHRRLTELCRATENQVRLITVEYDIKDDEPEGTEVFRLEPASNELTKKLVKRRFPKLSDVDARTIADFSGGNARVAIAIADTIGKNETVAGLTDNELFERLFQQRNVPDATLLNGAEACSLVYSFNGEDFATNEAELPKLAALVGQTAQELYKNIAELTRRTLVQRRSVWRAVLPHAIANRLAKKALQNIPLAIIEAHLLNGGERMLRSFSRRLGYLHDSTEAVQIVEKWFAPSGILSDLTQLNDFGHAIFANVTPICQTAALGAIENAVRGLNGESLLSDRNSHRSRIVGILRSMAYDAALFERCVALLVQFAEVEKPNNNSSAATQVLTSLHKIYLSGTHATVEQRIRSVKVLIGSEAPKRQVLGLMALDAALEAWHFNSNYSFDFGAWPRDFGYAPTTRKEQVMWFDSVIAFAVSVGCSDSPAAESIRSSFAKKFRGLWIKSGAYDALEKAAQSFSATAGWEEGWIAVKNVIRLDAKQMAPEVLQRLNAVELLLRPKNLFEKVRAFVCSRTWDPWEIAEAQGDAEPEKSYQRAEMQAAELGREVARDVSTFEILKPILVAGKNRHLFSFGRGLALAADNPVQLWGSLVDQFAVAPENERNVQVIAGFLHGLHEKDASTTNDLLDSAVADGVLGSWFPQLQIPILVDHDGIARLQKSLNIELAPIFAYKDLAYGMVANRIGGADLRRLLWSIASKPGGFEIAVEILSLQFHGEEGKLRALDFDLVAAGQELLKNDALKFSTDGFDYELARIVEACASDEGGVEAARSLCRNMNAAFTAYTASAFNYNDTMCALFKAQPSVGLDEFVLPVEFEEGNRFDCRAFEDLDDHHINPLSNIPVDEVIGWCEIDPVRRYPALASVVTSFEKRENKDGLQWTNLAKTLLLKTPNPQDVLERFVSNFSPTSWSGSRAEIMEQRVALLVELEAHDDIRIAEYASRKYAELMPIIEQEKRRELEQDKKNDERFE